MSDTTDLVIRRSKALLQAIDDRVAAHKARKKDGGYHGLGPSLADFYSEMRALRDAIGQHEGTTGHETIPFKSEITNNPGGTATRESHESFGLMSFSRTHGGPGYKRLFGSHVESHPTTICLRIKRAERSFSNDLSYDHYHDRELIVEVEMSAAQFADSITLMNHGVGVPCSLKYVNGVQMEPVPDEHRSEQHMIVESFAAKMADVRAGAGPLVEELEKILAKKSVGVKDKKEIAWLFEKLIRGMSDNAAFTMSQFNAATSKLETAAKREVESYANSVIMSAGLESLRAPVESAGEITVTPTKAIEGGEG